MNIVITGATGFLGKYVVQALSETHHLVLLGTDRSRLQTAFGDTRCLCLDTDYSQDDLETKLGGQKIDAIIHLAARRLSSTGLLSDYMDNIRITENLLCFSDSHAVGRMILASSQSVYRDDINQPPFMEEDAYASGVGRKYGYAYSKYICEQLACFYQTPVISLRFGQLLGWGEKEGFMFSTQLRKILHNEPIVLWGKGGGGRDYLYCKDAVAAIEKALVLSAPQTEVFNISMGTPISFRMFAEALTAVFGNEQSQIIYDTDKKEDEHIRYMCIDKAAKRLSWSPSYTLQDIFTDMKNDKNGKLYID